jgi:hypothetical protein
MARRARGGASAGSLLSLVFTLPAAIGAIAFHNKAVVYDLLFKTAAETLTTIAADPKHLGARVGLTAVLHTWGSALTHPRAFLLTRLSDAGPALSPSPPAKGRHPKPFSKADLADRDVPSRSFDRLCESRGQTLRREGSSAST